MGRIKKFKQESVTITKRVPKDSKEEINIAFDKVLKKYLVKK